MAIYFCIINKHANTMKNTDYSIDSLQWYISSESSLDVLLDMIGDMGLEIKDIKIA